MNWLRWLCAERRRAQHGVHFDYSVGSPAMKEKRMFEISLTNEQKVRVVLVPKTAAGTPAKVDGPPAWEVTSGDATLAVEPDGMSAELISGDRPGDSMVSVSADADLGAGVVTVAEVIVMHVLGANAESLGIQARLPEPK